MTNRSRLTRWDAIWAAGCATVLVLLAIAARTPYFDLLRVLFVSVGMLLSVLEWRSRGHGWFPTLSWAVPLGAVWMGGLLLVHRPVALGILFYWLGFGAMAAMLVSKRAARWWYEVVLRRSYEG